MKKILLALAVVLLTTAVGAQNVNKTALMQKIEKAEAAASDAKKATKAATWITLAKAYIDAAIEPTKGIYLSAPTMIVSGMGQPVAQPDAVTIGGEQVMRVPFDYLTVYANEANVIGWEPTAEVTPDAAGKALAALDKAYELDPKQASKIRTELVRLGNFSLAQGDALNSIEKYEAASEAFEIAFLIEQRPAFGGADPTRAYSAGATATVGAATNPALYARGEEMLTKALDMGFEDEQGMIYYFLYHALYGQRETDPAKLQKAKAVALLGYRKYPKNDMLLGNLISLYTNEPGMGDPAELIDEVDKRIAEEPANVELWFNRAQIFVELKNWDEAVASLGHAIEIDPNSYDANYFSGYYLIAKGDALNDAIEAKQYTSRDYAQMERDRQEVLGVYAQSVPYLERAHALNPSEASPVALLSAICFRLRDTSPEMMAKYEQYHALETQMNAQ